MNMHFDSPKMQAIWDRFPVATQTAMEKCMWRCPHGRRHTLSINVGVQNPADVGLVWLVVSIVDFMFMLRLISAPISAVVADAGLDFYLFKRQ